MASVNKAELELLYINQRKSIPDIAKIIGIGYSSTRTLLLNAGIKLRSRSDGISLNPFGIRAWVERINGEDCMLLLWSDKSEGVFRITRSSITSMRIKATTQSKI